MQQLKWLALGYNVPVQPSKNRVYVWRKLKEFGAGYFKQGVAILPKSQQSMARFRALAARIIEMGGEASIVELRFCDAADEQQMISHFRLQSEVEYTELIRDCANLLDNIRDNLFPSPAERAERVKKMLRRYDKVKSRDYFREGSHTEISGSLGELADDMTRTAGDLGRQLKNMLK